MNYLRVASVVLILCLSTACASITTWVGSKVSDNLTLAVMNNEDVGIIENGLPAYLIMVDAMIEANKNNVSMLLSGARLNGFVCDCVRLGNTSAKNCCLKRPCDMHCARRASKSPGCAKYAPCLFDQLTTRLQNLQQRHLATTYGLGSAWAGYLQVNSDDWAAVAELPRVKAFDDLGRRLGSVARRWCTVHVSRHF